MEKNLKFNSVVKNIEAVNPLFSKATVYVLYTGVNRNNSHISKSAVESSLSTIYNIPVIGEFLEEKDNFGGHGGKLEITDTEIKYVSTTKPYGVVPESANIYWENVTEKDGTVNEYLVVEGVYLWTGRYPELNVVLEHGKMNHSMEIEINNGDFSIVDGQEVFKIQDFTFSGLCILGIDKGNNPDEHVEPCFESSSIIVNYSLNKDKFKQEFSQMLAELKFSMSKGGNNLEEIKQEFETENKEVLDNEESTENKVDETPADTTDEAKEEVSDEKTNEEFTEEAQEDDTEEKSVDTSQVNEVFALTHNQIREQLRHQLNKGVSDHWDFNYWVVDYTDEYVVAEDYEDGCQLYKFNYHIENDKVKVNFESKQKVKVEYVPYDGESFSYAEMFDRLKEEFSVDKTTKEPQANEFEVKFNDLTEKFNTLQTELEDLRNFKRETLEKELSAKFEGQLTDVELAQVFEQSKGSTIEDIEKELFALVGKKNFSAFSVQPTTKIAVNMNKEVDSTPNSPYGDLFKKHLSK